MDDVGGSKSITLELGTTAQFSIENIFDHAFRLHVVGKIEDAQLLYEKIITVSPNHAQSLHSLGAIWYSKGQVLEAVKYFSMACQAKPGEAVFHHSLGAAFLGLQEVSKAIQCFEKALQINPAFAGALQSLIQALYMCGRISKAKRFERKLAALRNQAAKNYNDNGARLLNQGLFNEAIASFKQGILCNSNAPVLYNNLGLALTDVGKTDEAIACLRHAISLGDNLTLGHEQWRILQTSLAMALTSAGQLDEAIRIFQSVAGQDKNPTKTNFLLSFALLRKGNLEEGWPLYELRFQKESECTLHTVAARFSQPRWQGEPLDGKTILLYTEQGFGDAIQFVRYVTEVARRGAKVIVECPTALVRLFQTIPGISQVLAEGNSLPAFDFQCPLLSLPMVFSTTLDSIPHTVPYVTVPKELVSRWRSIVEEKSSAFKIGLVWAGRRWPGGANIAIDQRRSLSLAAFAPLAAVEGISWFSLQKGPPATQVKNAPEGPSIVDHGIELQDFTDTAALIANLDLVISVDTSVAHLAGALGKQVWLLSRFDGCWRWLLDRDDSPWYPTMRIFRQTRPGDWEGVIEKVGIELRSIVHS